MSLTNLEKQNLKKYEIAVDLYQRSILSEDEKGYDDSVEYGREKYGLTAQSVYKYKRSAKFLYYDSKTCILSNKFKITQLMELSVLDLSTAQMLFDKGVISHDLNCMELREIARKNKVKHKPLRRRDEYV